LPVVVIEARKSWLGVSLTELWAYHELLYFLAWRDIKVRYKQTALGVSWAILQPLVMMALFTVFFGKLVGVPQTGFPTHCLPSPASCPGRFFSSAATASGNSIVNSSHLITKVYFPRLIVPTAAVAAALVDFAITFVVLGALLAYYRVTPTWNMLMLPVLVAMLTVLSVAFGVLMSALNVKIPRR
jgi:lipopolysaccharide transport system permease protein